MQYALLPTMVAWWQWSNAITSTAVEEWEKFKNELLLVRWSYFSRLADEFEINWERTSAYFLFFLGKKRKGSFSSTFSRMHLCLLPPQKGEIWERGTLKKGRMTISKESRNGSERNLDICKHFQLLFTFPFFYRCFFCNSKPSQMNMKPNGCRFLTYRSKSQSQRCF